MEKKKRWSLKAEVLVLLCLVTFLAVKSAKTVEVNRRLGPDTGACLQSEQDSYEDIRQ